MCIYIKNLIFCEFRYDLEIVRFRWNSLKKMEDRCFVNFRWVYKRLVLEKTPSCPVFFSKSEIWSLLSMRITVFLSINGRHFYDIYIRIYTFVSSEIKLLVSCYIFIVKLMFNGCLEPRVMKNILILRPFFVLNEN